MVHRSTLKTAQTLLDRLFREAEGRTNHQLDVSFLLADLGLSRERADPGIDFLVSRGLLNTFGPEVAFLTEEGVRANVEELDLGTIGPARSFGAPAFAPPEAPEGPPSPRDDAPHLVHVRLDGETSTVPLGARCTIGRANDSDVPIDDKRASKRHAEVRYERGGYVLEDLESANGTLLNGAYCVEPTRLGNDDEIVIGRTMLVFQAPASFPPPSGADAPTPRPAAMPSGAPTERPGPATPDLADPGIRVVRGTPDVAGSRSDPAALFDAPAPAPQRDVFDALDDDSPFELDLKEDLAPPELSEPPFDPPEPTTSHEELFAGEAPARSPAQPEDSLVPTLLEDGPALASADPEEPLELSEVVELDDPVGGGPIPTGPAEDDLTTTMSVDLGAEHLPLAPSSLLEDTDAASDTTRAGRLDDAPPSRHEAPPSPLLEPPEPSDDLDRLAEDPAPRFLGALERLRVEVVAVAGADPSPLLDAIDLLSSHPLVRAFAEDEDPER